MRTTRRRQRPIWVRYGAAVVFTAAALVLKLLLARVVTRDEPVLLFFAAVMVSAVYGGLGPGLLCIGLSAVCDGYFFMAPFNRWQLNSVDEVWRLLVFMGEGFFICLICARMQSARQHAEASAAEAHELEGRLLAISDAEQRRIGHDLHDGLGQHLTGIALMTRRLERRLSAAASPDAEEASKLCELAKTAVAWTHDLSRSLSPPTPSSAGLPEALAELAAHAETLFQIKCESRWVGPAQRLDPTTSTHLYRIAQEAITNAVRHGQARHVAIRVNTTDADLSMQIIDDGSGTEPAAEPRDGMGLRIMRYRARMVGATLEVGHPAAGGTVITCRYRAPAGTAETNPISPQQEQHGIAARGEAQGNGVAG